MPGRTEIGASSAAGSLISGCFSVAVMGAVSCSVRDSCKPGSARVSGVTLGACGLAAWRRLLDSTTTPVVSEGPGISASKVLNVIGVISSLRSIRRHKPFNDSVRDFGDNRE